MLMFVRACSRRIHAISLGISPASKQRAMATTHTMATSLLESRGMVGAVLYISGPLYKERQFVSPTAYEGKMATTTTMHTKWFRNL